MIFSDAESDGYTLLDAPRPSVQALMQKAITDGRLPQMVIEEDAELTRAIALCLEILGIGTSSAQKQSAAAQALVGLCTHRKLRPAVDNLLVLRRLCRIIELTDSGTALAAAADALFAIADDATWKTKGGAAADFLREALTRCIGTLANVAQALRRQEGTAAASNAPSANSRLATGPAAAGGGSGSEGSPRDAAEQAALATAAAAALRQPALSLLPSPRLAEAAKALAACMAAGVSTVEPLAALAAIVRQCSGWDRGLVANAVMEAGAVGALVRAVAAGTVAYGGVRQAASAVVSDRARAEVQGREGSEESRAGGGDGGSNGASLGGSDVSLLDGASLLSGDGGSDSDGSTAAAAAAATAGGGTSSKPTDPDSSSCRTAAAAAGDGNNDASAGAAFNQPQPPPLRLSPSCRDAFDCLVDVLGSCSSGVSFGAAAAGLGTAVASGATQALESGAVDALLPLLHLATPEDATRALRTLLFLGHHHHHHPNPHGDDPKAGVNALAEAFAAGTAAERQPRVQGLLEASKRLLTPSSGCDAATRGCMLQLFSILLKAGALTVEQLRQEAPEVIEGAVSTLSNKAPNMAWPDFNGGATSAVRCQSAAAELAVPLLAWALASGQAEGAWREWLPAPSIAAALVRQVAGGTTSLRDLGLPVVECLAQALQLAAPKPLWEQFPFSTLGKFVNRVREHLEAEGSGLRDLHMAVVALVSAWSARGYRVLPFPVKSDLRTFIDELLALATCVLCKAGAACGGGGSGGSGRAATGSVAARRMSNGGAGADPSNDAMSRLGSGAGAGASNGVDVHGNEDGAPHKKGAAAASARGSSSSSSNCTASQTTCEHADASTAAPGGSEASLVVLLSTIAGVVNAVLACIYPSGMITGRPLKALSPCLSQVLLTASAPGPEGAPLFLYPCFSTKQNLRTGSFIVEQTAVLSVQLRWWFEDPPKLQSPEEFCNARRAGGPAGCGDPHTTIAATTAQPLLQALAAAVQRLNRLAARLAESSLSRPRDAPEAAGKVAAVLPVALRVAGSAAHVLGLSVLPGQNKFE